MTAPPSSLQPGQQTIGDAEERLVIVKVPYEQRPFSRENVVKALLSYGLDFEAVGRFSRGLEFQVLLENRSDADGLARKGYMEISNVKGVLCGCILRKFTQREFKIRVDWLPAIVTEREVAELFQRYGNVIKVYKEMAPQVRNYPRYWGGTFIVCLVPEDEEVVKDIADFQDVEIRGKIYSMSAVVLGLPPRCHRCKIRGHKAYQCTACRYCGSTQRKMPDVEGLLRCFRGQIWRSLRWRRRGTARGMKGSIRLLTPNRGH